MDKKLTEEELIKMNENVTEDEFKGFGYTRQKWIEHLLSQSTGLKQSLIMNDFAFRLLTVRSGKK